MSAVRGCKSVRVAGLVCSPLRASARAHNHQGSYLGIVLTTTCSYRFLAVAIASGRCICVPSLPVLVQSSPHVPCREIALGGRENVCCPCWDTKSFPQSFASIILLHIILLHIILLN